MKHLEEAVIEKVKPIFGIQSISPVYIVEKDMEVAKKSRSRLAQAKKTLKAKRLRL